MHNGNEHSFSPQTGPKWGRAAPSPPIMDPVEFARKAVQSMFPKLHTYMHWAILYRVMRQWLSGPSSQVYFDHMTVVPFLVRLGSPAADTATACKSVATNLVQSYLDGDPLHCMGEMRTQHIRMEDLRMDELYLAVSHASLANPADLEPRSVFNDAHAGRSGYYIDLGTVKTDAFAELCELPAELKEFTGGDEAQKLVKAALKRLDIASRLVGNSSMSGINGIAATADVDFGIQPILDLNTDVHDGAIPSNASKGPTELLDTLLTSGIQNTGAQQVSDALLFQSITLTNCMTRHTVWILGGVAVPQLPATFTVMDSARLFYKDGHIGVRLAGERRHHVTVALCRLKGRERRNESGILQQALLFFIAVPKGCSAYNNLERVQGLSYAELQCQNPAIAYRVFVLARRVSVALYDQSQREAVALNPEAVPFVPPKIKELLSSNKPKFDSISSNVLRILRGRGLSPVPWTNALWLEHKSAGLSVSNEAGRAARRYQRLLALESSTCSEDICRYDLINSRVSIALFREKSARRYSIIRVGQEMGNDASSEFSGGQKARDSPAVQRDEISHAPTLYRGPILPSLLSAGTISGNMDTNGPLRALLMLYVPGLPESRPGVVTGDVLDIWIADDKTSTRGYVGVVVSTQGSTCLVAPANEFWRDTGLDTALRAAGNPTWVRPRAFSGLVHVRFNYDGRSISHMQCALSIAANMKHTCLLPDALLSQQELHRLQPSINEVLELAEALEPTAQIQPSLPTKKQLNLEQRYAIAAIALGAGRATPYALHGPPGTGKTVTLVACALELISRYPTTRVLCCAPQNYSCDLMVSALAASGQLKPGQMLRVNDPRRPPFTVKEDVLKFCLMDDTVGMFRVPHTRQLEEARVTVTTCAAAALLYPEGSMGTEWQFYSSFPGFSHVLIDEGGQALLPEALIPLCLVKPPNGADATSPAWGSVICGDPRQLGPIVRSPTAAAEGLACSLLERLMAVHATAAPSLIAAGQVSGTSMLRPNYRSSASLLELPSKLFYSNELQAAADPASVLPPRWSALEEDPRRPEEEDDAEVACKDNSETTLITSSMLFYGVRGQQTREGDVPSYYNPVEAAAVADLVEGLLREGVNPQDVGVISTYRRQVQVIRLLLRQRKLGAVRVGTVDDYQGQEERVIFISTVLSRPSSIPARGGSDAHFALWRNPKRFNVAITRAKALLVVVGHPSVLPEDPSWRELVRQCVARGTFRGAGSAVLRERLGLMEENDGVDYEGEQKEESKEHGEGMQVELAKTIDQLADLALLGAGNASLIYPETIEEALAAYADETEWRILL